MNIFKDLYLKIFRPNGEKLTTNALRKMGFIGITICSVSLNMTFFQSLGESWVMPVCGIILVFMEIWNWVSAQEAHGIRKIFHYSAWLAICLTSILSVVSYGQTITAISSDAVVEAKAEETNKNTVRTDMYKQAKEAYKSAQDQINTATTLLAACSPYDKGPQERLAKQIKDAQEAQAKANALMEKYSGINEVSPAEQNKGISETVVKKNISARLLFSQVFTEAYADKAIKWFFIVFGIAMELTLSLSAMPPQRRIPNRRKISTLLWRFLNSKLQRKLAALEKNLEKIEEKKPEKKAKVKCENRVYSAPKVEIVSNPIEEVPVEFNLPKLEQMAVEESHEPEPTMEKSTEEAPITDMQIEAPAEVVVETPAVNVPVEVAAEEESLVDLMLPEEPEHKIESETAFLFKDSSLETLTDDEKNIFIENTIKIFGEIKKNNQGELSVKQMSSNVGLTIDEVKRMFKYFFNRNLLQYDDTSKRWKFKLKQDSIINYLKDKTIQY